VVHSQWLWALGGRGGGDSHRSPLCGDAYGPAQLFVVERAPEAFVVRVLQGEGYVEFSYRLMAKRVGYEGALMERAPWADDDPNLYP